MNGACADIFGWNGEGKSIFAPQISAFDEITTRVKLVCLPSGEGNGTGAHYLVPSGVGKVHIDTDSDSVSLLVHIDKIPKYVKKAVPTKKLARRGMYATRMIPVPVSLPEFKIPGLGYSPKGVMAFITESFARFLNRELSIEMFVSKE
jgi:hypothetical protein